MRTVSLLKKGIIGIVILFSAFVFFYQLGKAPLDNWDEAWYGEMAREMVVTHDFIIPHWNQAILIDKAPLGMWLTVVFSQFIGFSETSVRLTSALSGFAIILILFRYTYKKYGLTSALVAYLSLILNNIFIFRARSGNLDALTALLIFISYFVILSKNKYRLIVLAFLLASIYLARTSFVFFPFSIFFIHELAFRRVDFHKNLKNYFIFLLAFLASVSWWLFLGYQKLGAQFINYYVFASDQSTAHLALSQFKLNYLQYTYYSLQRRLFYLFMLGSVFMIPKIKKAEIFLQISFAFFLIVILSFSPRGNNWYLTPSMPFWSLIIGYATYRIIEYFKHFKPIILVFLVIIVYISFKTFTQNIIPIINTSSASGEAESGKYLASHVAKNDIVVRLDSFYPSTVYYSRRLVLDSAPDVPTGAYFLSRNDLVNFVKNGQIRWAVGQKAEVDSFLDVNSNLKHQLISINSNEVIIQFTESTQKNDVPASIRKNLEILQAPGN